MLTHVRCGVQRDIGAGDGEPLLRIPHRSVRFRDDEVGAAAVRAHHALGYELSPTVLVGGEYLTNPSPRQVREAIARRR